MTDNDRLIDKYFERIGYTGPQAPVLETLNGIVDAHIRAIPFENLDPILGRPVDLAPEVVERKLVEQRRGGYCFEQNGFLLVVLEALGFKAKGLAARVRFGRPREVLPARTHFFCRVDLDVDDWLVDVGLGWHDVCEFTLDDMPPIDRELANWYTSTHPQSYFRNNLIVARALPDGGRLNLLNRELTTRLRDGSSQPRVVSTPSELLETLECEFGLRLAPGTELVCAGLAW